MSNRLSTRNGKRFRARRRRGDMQPDVATRKTKQFRRGGWILATAFIHFHRRDSIWSAWL